MGNDTVIVLSLKEGEVMNKNFNILKDSVQQLRLKFDTTWLGYKNTIQKMHTDYAKERDGRIRLEQQYDTIYKKYTVNKMLYEKREKDWRNERFSIALITLLPYALLFIIAAK